jgi:prevent-host-death family protein
MKHLTISEARARLLGLPERLARTPERAVCITRHGRPALAVLPWDLYESLVENQIPVYSLPRWATPRELLPEAVRGPSCRPGWCRSTAPTATRSW